LCLRGSPSLRKKIKQLCHITCHESIAHKFYAYFYQNKKALKTILTEQQIALTIQRLAHQILENHLDLHDTVIIGLQPRGIYLSEKLVEELQKNLPTGKVQYGKLDITFYRDDVRRELHVPNKTEINFSIENKNVVLVDDVLYTGRTTRASLDALLDFGRPAKVELCVLIDRRFSRQLPIQPDYTGKVIDALITQKVKVQWKEKGETTQVIITE
jgi:pyrimidine operon attenuation protein/uracil phosphoribosyltransferase